ncbi:MAG: isoprenylcysteine carboxylmethyltransferase family protein [Candidatus Micrarchaeota archaeon]
MDGARIGKKALQVFIAAFVILSIMFFVPAGTLDFYQAWVYLAIIFVTAFFIVRYFLKNDPGFLERRMKTKEKEAKQRLITKVGIIPFVFGFIIPGLDRRFGWSSVPFELVIAADALVFLGYLFCFLAFKENCYASRVVEVVSGQKVISTGPYSLMRHPMYSGVMLMYAATPIALGSYFALIPFLLVVPVLVLRIQNEEEVLRRGLKGYPEYCKKVRYRLIPFIW